VTDTRTDALRFPLLPEQRRFLGRRLPGEHHWNQVRLFRLAETVRAGQLVQPDVPARHRGHRRRRGHDFKSVADVAVNTSSLRGAQRRSNPALFAA